MKIASLFVALAFLAAPAAAASEGAALAKVVSGAHRQPQNVARDRYRHPQEELEFFGIKPNMTVVEIWPGGGYWTEILGPYLKDQGGYFAAAQPAVSDEFRRQNAALQAKFDTDKTLFGKASVTEFGKGTEIAPPGSADMVLTFRNLHNWMHMGFADEAFATFYKALKPGGILGIEDHRARTDQPQDPQARSGYVRQDYAIQLAEKAGFKFVGASEINANPKDPKDGPVWRLPPTFAMEDKDRDVYAAIGEADNFVLKFQKPAN